MRYVYLNFTQRGIFMSIYGWFVENFYLYLTMILLLIATFYNSYAIDKKLCNRTNKTINIRFMSYFFWYFNKKQLNIISVRTLILQTINYFIFLFILFSIIISSILNYQLARFFLMFCIIMNYSFSIFVGLLLGIVTKEESNIKRI